MNIHSRGTADERCPTTGRPAEIAEADPAQDARNAPDPVPVTWARAQLRERIQQAGAALDPAAETARRQLREADRTPLADREPEP
jgi:hypothetical protein